MLRAAILVFVLVAGLVVAVLAGRYRGAGSINDPPAWLLLVAVAVVVLGLGVLATRWRR